MFAVIGTLAALHERTTSGRGQEVDVALYEAVAALMESSLAEAEIAGVVRGRSGGVLPGVAPSNAYPTAEGAEVLIAANADGVFKRLCLAIGRPELADDPRFADHQSRGDNTVDLDALIATWTSRYSSSDVIAIMTGHRVPCGRVYTAGDVLEDEHYRARHMILRLASASGQLIPMPGVVPRFSRTPGSVRTPGPRLGDDTDEVLKTVAGYDGSEIDAFRADQVIR
jgi:formyl-CoA transferase/succinyl-CoA--D-citramalate CoA-transferase